MLSLDIGVQSLLLLAALPQLGTTCLFGICQLLQLLLHGLAITRISQGAASLGTEARTASSKGTLRADCEHLQRLLYWLLWYTARNDAYT